MNILWFICLLKDKKDEMQIGIRLVKFLACILLFYSNITHGLAATHPVLSYSPHYFSIEITLAEDFESVSAKKRIYYSFLIAGSIGPSNYLQC